MSYEQFTLDQKYEICAYLKAGFSKLQIATELGVNTSTIHREPNRDTGGRGYGPQREQEKADARRRNVHKHFNSISDS